MHRESGEKLTIRGRFHKVHPHEKIIFAWHSALPAWKDALSLIPVEFGGKENNTHTELRLPHENLPDEPLRDRHIEGWNSMLDKIDLLFAARA